MNTTLAIILIVLALYFLACIRQWRRLGRYPAEQKQDPPPRRSGPARGNSAGARAARP